ncbi:putative phosphopantothenoylcysteine decarboxylase [Phaeomoniella chlamydospora]|uniref:Putative phosphopantothenoylcysteine decarboxylase n=1 Tax=Phaeomoniella chlamydospora TaxID=158046 RepID=A0A0G2EFA4_PHACM|nr:putative phosphopantothenoylcysteine decarboxylase [Phaeomoniella chlamydospora]
MQAIQIARRNFPMTSSASVGQLSKQDAGPFVASEHANDGKLHILLAATGSVATIKLPLIVRGLIQNNRDAVSVRIVITPSARQFLMGQSEEQPLLTEIPDVDGIYNDADEWVKPWVRGDAILHIELRRWADVMVVVPMSANSLAKMVNGISDGLVLSVLRAWDTEGQIDGPIKLSNGSQKRKTVFVAAAMNTAMWRHPVTRKQMATLKEWQEDGWLKILQPQQKYLACGDVGDGAMMDSREIVAEILAYLEIQG